MKISDLYKVARRNLVVKLICFVLAVFIYYFRYIEPLKDDMLVVPLQVSAQGTMLPAGITPSHVKVSLRGRQEDLSKISNQNVSAHLNLDYYTEPGTYKIPVQLDLAPDILEIPVELEVDDVKVAIALKSTVQVPLMPSIQGIPAAGYEIVDIRVEPSTIGVSGAEPVVQSLATVSTDAVPVDGKTSSFTQAVKVRQDSSLITYNEETVTVAVDIKPIVVTRRIAGQGIYLSQMDPSFIAQVEPKTIDLTLTGNPGQLDAFVPGQQTVRLDCSAINEPGTYELLVEVVLPNGIRLVSQSDRVATVSVVPATAVPEEGLIVEEEEVPVVEEVVEGGQTP